MAKRIPWDEFEAAILLDAYLSVEKDLLPRQEAITSVSCMLRERAIGKGMDIDPVFRNENGISLQLGAMQYVMTDGEKGIVHAPKIFRFIVDLYYDNPEEYELVLKEAIRQCGGARLWVEG